jgi:archaellum component FlaC
MIILECRRKIDYDSMYGVVAYVQFTRSDPHGGRVVNVDPLTEQVTAVREIQEHVAYDVHDAQTVAIHGPVGGQ